MISPEKSKFYADTIKKPIRFDRNNYKKDKKSESPNLRKDAFAHRKSQKKSLVDQSLIQKKPENSPSNSSEFSRENDRTRRRGALFSVEADLSSDDLNLEPVPLFEQHNSIDFKSEVFDSNFEPMKKGVPKVTVDLLSTPVKQKRVEMLRKSISKTSTIKLRNSLGDFRQKYYKSKPNLMEDFFVIGADLSKRPPVNAKEIFLPSKIMYMFSDKKEC